MVTIKIIDENKLSREDLISVITDLKYLAEAFLETYNYTQKECSFFNFGEHIEVTVK